MESSRLKHLEQPASRPWKSRALAALILSSVGGYGFLQCKNSRATDSQNGNQTVNSVPANPGRAQQERVAQIRNRDTTHIIAQTHTDQVRQMVLPNAISFIPTLETTIQTPLPVTPDEHGFIDLDQLLQERRALNTRMCSIGHMAAADIELYFDQHGGYYSHRDFVRVSQDILTFDFAIPNSSDEEDPAKSEATRNCMMRIFEEHAYALEDEGNTVRAKRIFAATANFISAIATCDGPENSPEQIRNCALEIIRENMDQIDDDRLVQFFHDCLYAYPELALVLFPTCTQKQKTAIIQAIDQLTTRSNELVAINADNDDLTEYQLEQYHEERERNNAFRWVQSALLSQQ
jgi:hypothetical protein